MLSILIPVYNYDVRELVERLHKQIVAEKIPFEILIADDASTSRNIKEHNQSVRKLSGCKLFQFSENKGRTFTRNFLAEKATYDWLLFLDADVLPKNADFITQFLTRMEENDVIFGGITYSENPPEDNKILRWKYGKAREAKPANKRKNKPYFSIISGALFIRKKLFLSVNVQLENTYGLDIVFIQKLKGKEAQVLHIENPVVHCGLETNAQFLEKTKKSLRTLIKLENQGKTSKNYRPIQKAYNKLKTYHLRGFFQRSLKLSHKKIEKNLLSEKPSLFLFDLYKLNYFLELKKDAK